MGHGPRRKHEHATEHAGHATLRAVANVVPNSERGHDMSLPRIATAEEHLAARRELLQREKELTRLRDELSTARRNLPMVEVTEDYRFDGPGGQVGLTDLFEGRPQLIVYHFHVRPVVARGPPELHRRHGRDRTRLPRPPAPPRHHLRDGVAGAAREARGVEGEARLDDAVVLVGRLRL